MVFLPPAVSFCARKLVMSVACCIRSLLRALTARFDSCCYRCEASTCCELFRLRNRRALITICREGVDALTVGVSGCGRAVSHHQIVAVLVTVFFLRSFKGALDVFDSSGTHSCFCHSLLAITRATSGTALVVALRNALALSSDYPQSSLVNLSGSSSKPDERG